MDKRRYPKGAAIFTNFDPEDINRVMQNSVKKYNWPTGFMYSCYCLRHSAATKAYEAVIQQAKAAVRQKLDHRQTGNESRYGDSAHVRAGKRGRQVL